MKTNPYLLKLKPKPLQKEKFERQRKERIRERENSWKEIQANEGRYAAHRAKVLAERRRHLILEHPISAKVFNVSTLLYTTAFQKTADKYNVVIGLRSPNHIGQMHLELGHPSKNFHIKAKSSNTGPTAGFIPEKALYSKVSINEKSKHDKCILESIKKGAKLVKLNLKECQIIQLLKHNKLKQVNRYKYRATYHGVCVFLQLIAMEMFLMTLELLKSLQTLQK
ncbi:putative insecticidal toxin complex [Vibrio astriarenae]|nr:putative insecticidal toxin complex [Vibrio sp. C7]